MKKLSPKIRLKRTLKIVDIDNNKLSEGLGRCPKYPQGTGKKWYKHHADKGNPAPRH